MAAVTVEIRVSCVNDADENLSDVDASLLCSAHEHKGDSQHYCNEDTAAEEYACDDNIGLALEGNQQIAQQEEDEQHKCNVFPYSYSASACRKYISQRTQELGIFPDIDDHLYDTDSEHSVYQDIQNAASPLTRLK